MENLNLKKYHMKELHSKTKYGNVITIITISETFPNQKGIHFNMYDEENENVASMYVKLYSHKAYIIEIFSEYENMGNGKQLLKHLIDFCQNISNEYRIDFIQGLLSPIDFSHWDKLLHFYSSLGKRFVLGKPYTYTHVVRNIEKYKHKYIDFFIWIV